MDTLDASSQPVISNDIRKNITNIKSIEIDDLDYLENDLDFYEKVSLMFLLCAQNRIRSKVLLQQLIDSSYNKNQQTRFIKSWAYENPLSNWRGILLEGLCVIQANHVILKLGLSQNELNQRYLPHNPDSRLFLHPIVKILYTVCERLTPEESVELVEYITSKYPSTQGLKFKGSGNYLEVHLFHWIAEGVLEVGEERPTTEPNGNERGYYQCNLEPIVDFLKIAEHEALRNIVKNSANKFNCERSSNRTDNERELVAVADEILKSFEERPKVEDREDQYLIRKDNAGITLIINQETFYQESHPDLQEFLPRQMLERRHGTDMDKSELERIFTSFGYKIVIKENLTHIEILNSVKNVANESTPYDSVVVCILSHGFKGSVYGANSIPVDIETIQKTLVTDRLIGKPKILIIQACQGDETQRARQIDYLAYDSPRFLTSLPSYSDLLVCFSTVPGYTSIRHTKRGSWFIQVLCDKLDLLADRNHFMDVLMQVTAEVISKRGSDNQCMVPVYHVILQKKLYFPQRN